MTGHTAFVLIALATMAAAPDTEVSSWTRVGFVREGTVPGFYKRSDGHLVGCVIGDRTASIEVGEDGIRLAERTIIGWTDHTFNIAWGCVKVSPGCTLCLATLAALTAATSSS